MRTIITALALLFAVAVTGCAAPKEVSTSPAKPSASESSDTESETPEGSNVTAVGQWARAEDGVEFRVSKLARGKVGSLAAGGNPGDPAAVVTVQMRNNSKKRFDMSLVQVEARVGEDGTEAEAVFQEGIGDGFTGTLAPGRTATAKFMFAAERAADLKKVSIEVTPGLEYDSFTFEGKL